MNFAYKATAASGKDERGEIEADSRQAALAKLQSRGLTIYDLTDSAKNKAPAHIAVPNRMNGWFVSNEKAASSLFFDLSLLTDAGMTVIDALQIIARSARADGGRLSAMRVLEKLGQGASVAAAFSGIDGISIDIGRRQRRPTAGDVCRHHETA
jgi:type II secretory pathway component PulF